MALSGQQFTLRAGEHEATVVEVGAGLRSYTFQGVDVIASYREDQISPHSAGAVLVPWPNRLRAGRYSFGEQAFQLPLTEPAKGNAIHGLARWERWMPVRADDSSVTLRLDIVPQVGWPFEVSVELTYALHPEFGLGVTVGATNTGTSPAPFGAGFHPYFALHGTPLADVTLQVPAELRLVTDDAQVPVGTQDVAKSHYDLRNGRRLRSERFDDGFTGLSTVDGRGRAEVRTRSGGAALWFDAAFGYLQVYTTEDFAPGVPAVAIEPMTCPADAFNTGDGLIVLPPGGAWSASWGIAPLVVV